MRAGRYLGAVALILATQLSIGGELTGNAGITNNYIWRGLTQSENEAAISGGIDYASDTGLYVGTWVSNVSYAPNDAFSYEHDIYFGYAGEFEELSYDIGYLYYNYDEAANFDFGEIYGSLGYKGFTLGGFLLANTEADENQFQDFGFGEAYYVYLDYTTEIRDGLELTLHAGRHDGDFNEAFNAVPGSYNDYHVSLSKNGFSFMITDTDLANPTGPDPLDNDEVKIVVSYTMDFDL